MSLSPAPTMTTRALLTAALVAALLAGLAAAYHSTTQWRLAVEHADSLARVAAASQLRNDSLLQANAALSLQVETLVGDLERSESLYQSNLATLAASADEAASTAASIEAQLRASLDASAQAHLDSLITQYDIERLALRGQLSLATQRLNQTIYTLQQTYSALRSYESLVVSLRQTIDEQSLAIDAYQRASSMGLLPRALSTLTSTSGLILTGAAIGALAIFVF